MNIIGFSFLLQLIIYTAAFIFKHQARQGFSNGNKCVTRIHFFCMSQWVNLRFLAVALIGWQNDFVERWKLKKDFHEFYIYNCFRQISIKFSFSNADIFGVKYLYFCFAVAGPFWKINFSQTIFPQVTTFQIFLKYILFDD